jgi:SagB-type dehydrogenase family enzyme
MYESQREFLKDTVRLSIDFAQVDQHRGVAPPAIEKPLPPGARPIDLPGPAEFADLPAIDLRQAIAQRVSRREFSSAALGLKELAFLLWATQGVRRQVAPGVALRTVPSAGARHALETYLAVFRVTGLQPAFYRYLPLEHQLLLEFQHPQAEIALAEAALGQVFVGRSAVTFLWTAVPYRMEWRYGAAAHKAIALDAGHVCQNLYLACEAIGAGTCAVAAYHQHRMDRLLRVDGQDEFVVYLAPVGKT